jgi:hypothetical protein
MQSSMSPTNETAAAHPGVGAQGDLWTDVKCGDLVKNQKTVIIDSELSVEAAAEVRWDSANIDFSSKWNFFGPSL